MATGDLNGDGLLDLATAVFETSSVAVLLGDGSGRFPASTVYHLNAPPNDLDTQHPNAIAIGDLNGDGTLDLTTLGFTSTLLVELLNQ